jgi:hypothetical protein
MKHAADIKPDFTALDRVSDLTDFLFDEGTEGVMTGYFSHYEEPMYESNDPDGRFFWGEILELVGAVIELDSGATEYLTRAECEARFGAKTILNMDAHATDERCDELEYA